LIPVIKIALMRRLATLLFLGAGLASAQTAVQPTSGPANAPVADAVSTPVVQAGSIADVTYASGLLTISADNSSLNQILREIARQTGMKITGSVSDERVFGRYGPSTPARALASLLDGTGSNMLLRETASNAPAELILTPRQGGPTPPQPTAPDSAASAPSPGITPAWAAFPVRNPVSAPVPPVENTWQAQQQNLQRIQQMQQQQSSQHGIPH
jgi:hypothetical protein